MSIYERTILFIRAYLNMQHSKAGVASHENDVYSYQNQYDQPYQFETQEYSNYQPTYNADYFKNYQYQVRFIFNEKLILPLISNRISFIHTINIWLI